MPVIYRNKVKYMGSSDIQKITMPAASEAELGHIYQYIGTTDANYTNGYFYQCIVDPGVPGTYAWQVVEVSPGGSSSIQVDALPTASAVLEGTIYQYVGETSGGYINGYFYQCVEDTDTPGTYLWLTKNTQQAGHQILDDSFSFVTRSGLQFDGFDVMDDSVNDATVVKSHLITSAEFAEIFDSDPAFSVDSYKRFDTRNNIYEIGRFVTPSGMRPVYEKFIEIPVPVAVVSEATESLVSIGADVDFYVSMYGIVGVDGVYTNIVWGAPNVASTGVMLIAYANDDTSGHANSAGISYVGDITSFDRIFVCVQFTVVPEE